MALVQALFQNSGSEVRDFGLAENARHLDEILGLIENALVMSGDEHGGGLTLLLELQMGRGELLPVAFVGWPLFHDAGDPTDHFRVLSALMQGGQEHVVPLSRRPAAGPDGLVKSPFQMFGRGLVLLGAVVDPGRPDPLFRRDHSGLVQPGAHPPGGLVVTVQQRQDLSGVDQGPQTGILVQAVQFQFLVRQ